MFFAAKLAQDKFVQLCWIIIIILITACTPLRDSRVMARPIRSWTSCQVISGAAQRDKQLYILTFPPKVTNSCLWSVEGKQYLYRTPKDTRTRNSEILWTCFEVAALRTAPLCAKCPVIIAYTRQSNRLQNLQTHCYHLRCNLVTLEGLVLANICSHVEDVSSYLRLWCLKFARHCRGRLCLSICNGEKVDASMDEGEDWGSRGRVTLRSDPTQLEFHISL